MKLCADYSSFLVPFFLLLMACPTEAVSFPEDDEPINTIEFHHSRQYPIFRGRLLGNESLHRLDYQLMLKIEDILYIAGRDQVYAINLNDPPRGEIISSKKLTWKSRQQDRSNCAMKGKHKDECHNFIKVFVPKSDDTVFVCGTNAFNPVCRYYRLDTLDHNGEEVSGLARCPFDAKQTNVALFADNKLYSATVADFLASDAVIYRSMGDGIPGSAVCAFNMEDIEKSFKGRFKEQKTPDSVWTAVPEDRVPKPRPGCCAGHGPAESYKTSIDFPDETLSFIKSHPLMDSAVPSLIEEPWFTKTRVRYRLTAIAIDNAAGPRQNYTVTFIGSEAGMVLKVLTKTSPSSLNDSILLEEMDVFNPLKCNAANEDDRKVLGLQIDKDHHALFVAFSSCVIRVPLSHCEHYGTCKKACVGSQDPYCAWLDNKSCGIVRPGVNTVFEQDVESGNTAHLGECHEILATTPDYKTFGDPTSDTDLSALSASTGASGPVVSPNLIGSRKVAVQDDMDTYDYFEPLSAVPNGVRWEVQSGDANQMVHMNVLITCVLAAFVLGAFISGIAVYCHRDTYLRKARKMNKDAESAQSCTDSSGSFTKFNGLFDSPVKEYPQNIDTPKLYTNLLSNGKELPPSGDAKSMIVDSHGQPPELAALPTPESTPVLQQKRIDAKGLLCWLNCGQVHPLLSEEKKLKNEKNKMLKYVTFKNV
ncbi:hypothetical protein scyTo_0005782 [Scyliorhinus torazame]|uniref:Sema domain-containing protein n=1 Tax=Scyliorhinus torazame TaxID=75743 RepID=A0A401PCG0_SCYTO|nr:hypothetical protein [Scyliorhinus torazame]